MEDLSFERKMSLIQNELKAPKGQFNKFGNYNFRSCEDIVESVKPILNKYGMTLNLSDEIVLIGDRYYIKATATIFDGLNRSQSTGYAREPAELKGMNESQITGAASSFARKYALNGLLAIDDTKDADTEEFAKQIKQEPKKEKKADKEVKVDYKRQAVIAELNDLGIKLEQVATYLGKAPEDLTVEEIQKIIEKKVKQNAKSKA